jgi:hypothetical protein
VYLYDLSSKDSKILFLAGKHRAVKFIYTHIGDLGGHLSLHLLFLILLLVR